MKTYRTSLDANIELEKRIYYEKKRRGASAIEFNSEIFVAVIVENEDILNVEYFIPSTSRTINLEQLLKVEHIIGQQKLIGD